MFIGVSDVAVVLHQHIFSAAGHPLSNCTLPVCSLSNDRAYHDTSALRFLHAGWPSASRAFAAWRIVGSGVLPKPSCKQESDANMSATLRLLTCSCSTSAWCSASPSLTAGSARLRIAAMLCSAPVSRLRGRPDLSLVGAMPDRAAAGSDLLR